VAEAVRVLVAGLPAEIVREIGLRIRGAAVTEFENTQQMGRAASQGEAKLVILSDTLPTADSIYVARRARDASDAVRIAYVISMAQAESALHALKEISVDRFFFSPVDIEEMLRELAKMCKAEVLPPQASHGENIAAAVVDAWDRARASTFKKIDILDDAAIALLDNGLTSDLKKMAEAESQSLADLSAEIRISARLADRTRDRGKVFERLDHSGRRRRDLRAASRAACGARWFPPTTAGGSTPGTRRSGTLSTRR